jgi:ferredoxin-NADP reductase
MRLVVTARQVLADGVVGLSLADVDGAPLPAWEPGAHVDLHLRPDLVRQYSLCGDPADRRTWRLAVLREPSGRGGSAHVHDRLTVGERVAVAGPRNRFPLLRSPNYLFIAGGIGITPILPMLAAAQRSGARWRLVYGGRRRASMAFRTELEAYGARVTVWPQDHCGLLDLETLLGTLEPDTLVYCCGPEPLLAAVEERCRAWPQGALHVERFAAAPAPGDAFEVELRASGRVLTVPAGVSILRAVEDAGVAVLSSCREGTCGTCETDVLHGVPDHRDAVLTGAERAAGDVMMICVSRALTPRLVLDL